MQVRQSLAALGLFIACFLPIFSLAQTFEEQVIERVNQERWQNGQLPPLKYNSTLAQVAASHSRRMPFFNIIQDAHNDPVFGGPLKRTCIANYFDCDENYKVNVSVSGTWANGENAAAGQATPAAVMGFWMNSDAHRANILNQSFCEIGVGYFFNSTATYKHYWAQSFGCTSAASRFVIINREGYETNTTTVELYLYGQGISQIRLRNSDGEWADWQPFTHYINWQLSGNAGENTVEVEMMQDGDIHSVGDSIMLRGDNQLLNDNFD